MRSTALAVTAIAVIVAACSPALEKAERPTVTEPVTGAAVGEAGSSTSAPDAADASAAVDAAEDGGERVEVARGPGACPAWLPSSHRAFASARTSETPAFPRAELGLNEPTCCWVTTSDLLCRKPVSAAHVVGETYGSRLLGLRRGAARPWLDALLEVRSHGTMKYAGALLVRLDANVTGDVVTLSLREAPVIRRGSPSNSTQRN